MNHPKILAIDPGTKEVGVAVLYGGRFEYYGVKTFKHRRPPHTFLGAVAQYVDALIDTYQPDALAIEETFLLQKNAALVSVTAAEIKSAAEAHHVPIYEYNPVEVREKICSKEKATKLETAQALAVRYPELARFLRQPSQWEALYWSHMFDAIAIALAHYYELA